MSAPSRGAVMEPGAPNGLQTRVRQIISDMLLAGDLHDPRLRHAVITRVWVSEDVQLARVYLRVYDVAGDPGEDRKDGLLRALRGAKRRLQSGLSRQLKLRRTPELTFFWDTELEEVRRVDALLGTLEGDTGA